MTSTFWREQKQLAQNISLKTVGVHVIHREPHFMWCLRETSNYAKENKKSEELYKPCLNVISCLGQDIKLVSASSNRNNELFCNWCVSLMPIFITTNQIVCCPPPEDFCAVSAQNMYPNKKVRPFISIWREGKCLLRNMNLFVLHKKAFSFHF